MHKNAQTMTCAISVIRQNIDSCADCFYHAAWNADAVYEMNEMKVR